MPLSVSNETTRRRAINSPRSPIIRAFEENVSSSALVFFISTPKGEEGE